jgi:putative ABC transport system permease protein
VALGAVFGAGVTMATLVPFSHAMTGSLVPSTPLLWCGLIGLAAVSLAMVGTLLPTRLSLRSRPVDSIGVRQ